MIVEQPSDDSSSELIERFASIPTANVADAMERMGALIGIQPVWKGARLAGSAFTVWTRAGDNIKIHEAIDLAAPGDVIVVNGEGDTSRALIGELMGAKAKQAGIAGFVVDGMVRDAEGLRQLGLGVFARGVTPAGPYKNGPGRLQEPIAVGSVAVVPGDFVLGDDDGVVIVPRGRANEILEQAERILAAEEVQRSQP